jgi:malate dehydrogenase (quinone)
MLDLLKRCFPEQWPAWTEKVTSLVPHYGVKLNDDAELAERVQNETAEVLGIAPVS